MPTLKQKRLIVELPKSNWSVEPAMKAAGYSTSHARHNQKLVMESKGIQELLANIGINEDWLINEYIKIAGQNKDNTNKRITIENLLAKINPNSDLRLSSKQITSSLNLTSIYISDSGERKRRIEELTKNLFRNNEMQSTFVDKC